MFKLQINTGNAAFHPYSDAEELTDQDLCEAGPELARILRKLADALEDGTADAAEVLTDYNGNRVGLSEYTPD